MLRLSTPLSNVLTMSSREIAELTKKAHPKVTSDIKKLIDRHPCMSVQVYTYRDSMNRPQKEYILQHQDVNRLLESYLGALRLPLSIQERAALDAIEQVLGVNLERQYRVGSYRIDGYDLANNTVYEIDEPHHRYTTRKDKERQEHIEKALNCKFVRINVGY